MDLVNGEVSNIEKNYVIGYYIDFLSKFWDLAIYPHLIGNYF